jgi:hypothetical protein
MSYRIKALRLETCPPLARHLFGGFVWRSGHSYKACERLSFAAFLIVGGLFYFAFATSSAVADTYYLDAVNGNDINAGTNQSPWKTLAKARATVQAGDTVKLRNGNYGNFSMTSFTSISDWITYEADTGHTPVFTKIYIYLGSPNKNVYHKFDGITIQEVDPGLDPNDPQSWTYTYACRIYHANYIQLNNCIISGWSK